MTPVRSARGSTAASRRQTGVALLACLIYALLPGVLAVHAWTHHGASDHAAAAAPACSHHADAEDGDGEGSTVPHDHAAHCDLCRMLGTVAASGLLPSVPSQARAATDVFDTLAPPIVEPVRSLPAGHLFSPRGPPEA